MVDILDAPVRNGTDGAAGAPGPVGPIGNSLYRATDAADVLTLDPSDATDYTFLIRGDYSLVASGFSLGASVTVNLLQDGTGGWDTTLPVNWIGADQIVLSTTANELDTLVIWRTYLGIHVLHTFSGENTSGLWTPDALTNRVAWFQADSIPGVDGETVTAWNNQYASTDLTATGSPVLHIDDSARRYVSFGGAAYMDATHTPSVGIPFTYAFVAKVPGNGVVIGGSNIGAFDVTTASGVWRGNAGTDQDGAANTGIWQTVVIQLVAGSNNDSIRVDGDATHSALNLGTGKSGKYTRLFGDDTGTFGTGSIAELVKTSAALTGPELANLETYLNTIRDELNS